MALLVLVMKWWQREWGRSGIWICKSEMGSWVGLVEAISLLAHSCGICGLFNRISTSQNNHMFNSQLRKQSAQFHGQDGFGSGSGSRISITAPQSDSRRRRRRGVGGSGGHLFPEAISQYAPQTYDAVWAIALALRAAEEHWRRNEEQSKLDGFDYTRSDMAWEFLQQMGKLHFLGVSVSNQPCLISDFQLKS